MGAALVSIESLRAKIREIEGRSVEPTRAPSGVPVLDDLVGGLPSPGVTEISGPRGSGRMRLAAAIASGRRLGSHPQAWVDVGARLHPPGLASLGVDLSRAVVVVPPADRDVWAIEQVLRSGCFPVVFVVDPRLRRSVGARWERAAEQGGCALVVVSEHAQRDLPAAVRLAVARGRVAVLRDRQGGAGREGALPGALPW